MVTCVRSAGASRYSQVRHHLRICLQSIYLHPSARRLRGRRRTVTFSSLLRLPQKFRNIDRMSFGAPFRVVLRPRLTLIRLTLIRNPWSCGVNVSHIHYRYLCLHLLFQTLQNASRRTFSTAWNAPLPILIQSQWHCFGSMLDTRLLSTPGRSTSELLRTL